jgi:hypothetical protein
MPSDACLGDCAYTRGKYCKPTHEMKHLQVSPTQKMRTDYSPLLTEPHEASLEGATMHKPADARHRCQTASNIPTHTFWPFAAAPQSNPEKRYNSDTINSRNNIIVHGKCATLAVIP